MKYCNDQECPGVQRLGRPLAYANTVQECAECGGPLQPEARRASPGAKVSGKGDLLRRALVTFGAMALVLLGMLTVAPGVDWAGLQARGGLLGVFLSTRNTVSILSIGIVPFATAAVVAEMIAFVIPSLWAARHQGPKERLRIDLIAAIIGTSLAGLQARSIASSLEGFVIDDSFSKYVFVGGSLAMLGLARLVTRYGLTDGLPLLYVFQLAVRSAVALSEQLQARAQHRAPPGAMLLDVVTVLALVAATAALLVFFTRRPAALTQEPAAESYREQTTPAAAPFFLPVPASGLVPLVLVLVFPHFLMTLGAYGVLPFWAINWARASLLDSALISSAAVLLLVPLFARVFQPASEVLLFHLRAFPQASELALERPSRVALRKTLLLFAGFLLLRAAFPEATDHGSRLATIALGSAIVIDAVAEGRLRAACGELALAAQEHRPHVAAALLLKLRSEGIPVAARGLTPRSLLRFFGPYAPISLLVPVEQAARARKLLTQVTSEPRARRRKAKKDSGAAPA